ncbi:MAG: translation initiation factor IF-3 [Chloroflexi bacterium]|nr:translation initiation factor IF-3 [Chloroflexota bacterium]
MLYSPQCVAGNGRWSGIARDYRVNQQIRAREVRVIGDNGEQIGILPLFRALQMAREQDLDLVEVAPTAAPPVCRLMDYGRFRYETTKRQRDTRRTSKLAILREIRFRTRIGEHDKQAKIRHIREILQDGDKVKAVIVFRGREITHQEIGLALLRSIADSLKNDAKLETTPALEGRMLSIILAPLPRREVRAPKETPKEATEKQDEQKAQEAQAQDP